MCFHKTALGNVNDILAQKLIIVGEVSPQYISNRDTVNHFRSESGFRAAPGSTRICLSGSRYSVTWKIILK